MNILLRLDREGKDQLYLLAYGQSSLMMRKTKCLAIKGQNLFVPEPKDAQLQKGFLPCWSFYIQLWDLVAAPGFWAPQDHQSVRWSHFTQTQVQRVIQTSWQVRNISIPAESYTRPGQQLLQTALAQLGMLAVIFIILAGGLLRECVPHVHALP